MSYAEALDPGVAFARFEIPERREAALDRALDATERCLARHGLRRTTMSDIAREMGVSRPTLYKQVASVEDALALVGARQLYAFLDELQALMTNGARPDTFIEMAVHAVSFARTSPIVQRVLAYEPDLVGGVITSGQIAGHIEQVVDLLTPLLRAAMDARAVRAGDPRLTSELIVRLCGSLRLGDLLGMADEDRAALYYVGLLAWVGCVSDSHELALWIGDDLAWRAASYEIDPTDPGALEFLAGRAAAVHAPLAAERGDPSVLRSSTFETASLPATSPSAWRSVRTSPSPSFSCSSAGMVAAGRAASPATPSPCRPESSSSAMYWSRSITAAARRRWWSWPRSAAAGSSIPGWSSWSAATPGIFSASWVPLTAGTRCLLRSPGSAWR